MLCLGAVLGIQVLLLPDRLRHLRNISCWLLFTRANGSLVFFQCPLHWLTNYSRTDDRVLLQGKNILCQMQCSSRMKFHNDGRPKTFCRPQHRHCVDETSQDDVFKCVHKNNAWTWMVLVRDNPEMNSLPARERADHHDDVLYQIMLLCTSLKMMSALIFI